jgi:hypothetical protein
MDEGVRRFVLEGGGRMEDVPASDIAVLIDGVVRAVMRAAGHVVGRELKPTGRPEHVVASAAQIRLIALRSSSVEFEFAPAQPVNLPGTFAFDIQSLSERALGIAVESAAGRGQSHPDVIRAWVDTARKLGVGKRYKRLRALDLAGHELARIDAESLPHLRALANARVRDIPMTGVQGRLYEANFDTATALLETPSHEVVRVQFDQALADDIYRVLRGSANLVGDITYDPQAMRATSIHVSEVQRPRQLDLSFWQEKPIAEIAEEQGLAPVRDASSLTIAGLSRDEWAALRAAMDR